jgi:hypothetical protein
MYVHAVWRVCVYLYQRGPMDRAYGASVRRACVCVAVGPGNCLPACLVHMLSCRQERISQLAGRAHTTPTRSNRRLMRLCHGRGHKSQDTARAVSALGPLGLLISFGAQASTFIKGEVPPSTQVYNLTSKVMLMAPGCRLVLCVSLSRMSRTRHLRRRRRRRRRLRAAGATPKQIRHAAACVRARQPP